MGILITESNYLITLKIENKAKEIKVLIFMDLEDVCLPIFREKYVTKVSGFGFTKFGLTMGCKGIF